MSTSSHHPAPHDEHSDLAQEDTRKNRPNTRIFIWSRILDFSTRLSTVLFVAALCTVVGITCIPQRKAVAQLERQLERTQEQQDSSLDNKELSAQKLHALRTDPSYLEIKARDRLDYYLPGETVIRIRRPQ